ncbi:MAG: hypothetical protein RIC35_16395 [Marinoscillum sp.]
MKNLLKSSLALIAVASMIFITSCGDGDTEEPKPNAPTLTVTTELNGTAATSPIEAKPGDEVSFDVSITADGGFNVVRVYSSVDGGSASLVQELTRLDLNLEAGSTTASASFTSTIEAQLVGSEVTYEFEAVDDADQVSTAEVIVNVTDNPIVTQTETLLGGQSNASADSFYNSIENETYPYDSFRDNNSANTDFCFFYGNTNMYTIAAIDDEDANTAFSAVISDNALGSAIIETRNETRFVTTAVSPEDFDAIDGESALLDAFGDVTPSATKQNMLEANTVFAFQLAESRGSLKGLAKVISTGGTSGADRSITILVKIQEEAE